VRRVLEGRLVLRLRRLVARYGKGAGIASVALFAALFVWTQRADLREAVAVVAGAAPSWLVAFVVVQALVLAISGLTYLVVYRRLGHRLSLPWLVDMHLQRLIVSTVAPAGGPASLLVLVRALNRAGVSTSNVLLGATLRSVTGYAAFVTVLIPALLLSRPEGVFLVATLLLGLTLLGILAGLLVVLRGYAGPDWLQARYPERVREFIAQAHAHEITLRDLLLPWASAVGVNLAGVAALYLALHAVGQQPTPAMALAGFAVGAFFQTVAPVFGGVGAVELSMAVVLQQLGVPGPAAVAATLLFRAGDVWLPLLLGLLSQATQRVVLVARGA
jgi:phosphatidylglycerol lysyltransferase